MIKHETFDAASESLAEQIADLADSVVHEAAERERKGAESSLTYWSEEMQRYFGELLQHNMSALEELRACKSSVDVLRVEQRWWSARSKSYMDSGLRLAEAFADVVKELP
jgi:hypothetical protein